MERIFEVVMIGNTAVGKTSMLAALSMELDSYNISGDVSLEPTTHEFRILNNQWTDTGRKIEAQEPFSPLEGGLAGQLDFVEHKFDFKVDGETEARVLFTDTRGGMTGDLDERLIQRVNEAFGVFCVVDASVLMECSDSTNERFNCPKVVKRLLKEVYTDGDDKQPKFVTFVLTKCEKYMATANDRQKLAEKFLTKYDNIVDMLCNVNWPRVYLVAIQTMGCVSFYKLNKEGLPMFRVLPETEFKSKDCAIPLVILLDSLIDEIENSKSIWVIILNLLGIGKNLRDYKERIWNSIEKPSLSERLV